MDFGSTNCSAESLLLYFTLFILFYLPVKTVKIKSKEDYFLKKALTHQTEIKQQAATQTDCCVFSCLCALAKKLHSFTVQRQQPVNNRLVGLCAAPAPRQIPIHRYASHCYD